MATGDWVETGTQMNAAMKAAQANRRASHRRDRNARWPEKTRTNANQTNAAGASTASFSFASASSRPPVA